MTNEKVRKKEKNVPEGLMLSVFVFGAPPSPFPSIEAASEHLVESLISSNPNPTSLHFPFFLTTIHGPFDVLAHWPETPLEASQNNPVEEEQDIAPHKQS